MNLDLIHRQHAAILCRFVPDCYVCVDTLRMVDGDQLWLLFGATTAFVLRKTESVFVLICASSLVRFSGDKYVLDLSTYDPV